MNVSWIDIKKSVPAYDDEVLFCVEGGPSHAPADRWVTVGKRIATNKNGEEFDITGYVTHWAPKPELPSR